MSGVKIFASQYPNSPHPQFSSALMHIGKGVYIEGIHGVLGLKHMPMEIMYM